MKVRRVVTGLDDAGKAVVVEDGEPSRQVDLQALPGVQFFELWATDGVPSTAAGWVDHTAVMQSFIPQPGGVRVRIWTMPPDSASVWKQRSPMEIGAEVAARLPGFERTFDPKIPGMHVTPTVDVDVVLSGELWLELDDGLERKLGPGDCVVMNATRHNWHNRGKETAAVATFMMGSAPD